jgi:hypothetical protein
MELERSGFAVDVLLTGRPSAQVRRKNIVRKREVLHPLRRLVIEQQPNESRLKEHQAGPRILSCELILQARRIVACPHYTAFMAFL